MPEEFRLCRVLDEETGEKVIGVELYDNEIGKLQRIVVEDGVLKVDPWGELVRVTEYRKLRLVPEGEDV